MLLIALDIYLVAIFAYLFSVILTTVIYIVNMRLGLVIEFLQFDYEYEYESSNDHSIMIPGIASHT